MLVVVILLVVVSGWLLLTPTTRRRKGERFDWTHRRRWWRPRWAFPDDR
jgi:hypothetical protein